MYFSTRNRLMAGAKMQLPLIEELCKLCCFAGDGQPFERGQMMSILCDGGYNFASEFISVCLFFFFFFILFFPNEWKQPNSSPQSAKNRKRGMISNERTCFR